MCARLPSLPAVCLALVLGLLLASAGCGQEEEPSVPGAPEVGEPPAPDVEASRPAGEEVGMPVEVQREGPPQPPTPEEDPTEPQAGDVRPTEPAVAASFPCIPGDAEKGAEHYAALCASCHGARGDGQGPAAAGLNPKPARHDDGATMNDLSNDYLFKIIKEGGAAVGKSPLMAPWGGTLSDAQIWDVVAFVRSLAEPAYHCPEQ